MAGSRRPPCIPPGGLLFLAFIFLSIAIPGVRLVQCEEEDMYEEDADPYFKVVPLDNSIKNISYDARSLMINGKREVFICGAIHYPRVLPEYWDDILLKTRMGGCNCIQTYVFWNVHEHVKGQYNFAGGADIVAFIKKAASYGLYVILRIGPFIQAEWNHGGLPYWLREEKNITFRTNNYAYKKNMQEWTTKIVNIMKENKLYAGQGGPIFLSQIENEYEHVKAAFKEDGPRYIKWAAKMALEQNTGVPWVMCKQKDTPIEVINACNGRRCAETFNGPDMPTKPKIWTENWTAQYRVFGDPPSKRGAEDLALSVAHWFAKDGTHVSYYMYYGGTSFGRNTGAFVTTRYYDEAPIDEYGMLREPKYSHLRDLHYALQMSKNALWGEHHFQKVDHDREIWTFENVEAKSCVAFLRNNNSHRDLDIKFRGKAFTLPTKSMSILPDCKTAVYNTDMVVSQHNIRDYTKSESVHKALQWEMTTEPVPELGGTFSKLPLEQFHFCKDTTDYMWYMTSIELDAYDLPFRRSIQPVLDIISLGHSLVLFVNGKYAGHAHGTKKDFKFGYSKAVQLHEGVNHFAFLQSTLGLPDSGAYMEKRFTGIRTLIVQGLGTGNLDLTSNGWHHKAGLEGERLQYFTEEGSKKAKWTPVKGKPSSMSWYKARFDAPEGNQPLAIKMDNMTKGMIWVNGFSIGRYWATYITETGGPSQDEYHIPRSLIKPKDNLIVIFDELGGLINEVDISTTDRNVVCSWIGENYLPPVSSFKWEGNDLIPKEGTSPKSVLQCPKDTVVKEVMFASFGDPWGICGLFKETPCHAKDSKKIVEKICLGKKSCEIPVDRKVLLPDGDPCPDVKVKKLAVQLKCGPK